jgi:trimeric autotransporter adhesin
LTGSFDGNGHNIANWASSPRALFFASTGTVKNLHLVNVIINGGGINRTGAMVGFNEPGGVVTNCTVAGGSVSDPDYFVGGLVGLNFGTISHCSANVAVSGGSGVGGLVGENDGNISDSFATGPVSGNISANLEGIGGLAGTNTAPGAILNSYATGPVSGVSSVGGAIGYNTGTLTNLYAVGSVSGSGANIGGLLGSAAGGTVSASYWNTQTSGQATSPAGTAETTAAMQSQATFSGWDFASVWNAPSGAYPSLK